jgi:histidinol-phosphate aminotransferase
MLQNKNTFLAHTKKVMGLKSELYEEMAKIEGLKVYNSSTNFLTFSLGENSDKLFEYLKDSDIAIRDVGAHPVLKNHLRVSIGSKEQNEFFLTKVKEFVLKY